MNFAKAVLFPERAHGPFKRRLHRENELLSWIPQADLAMIYPFIQSGILGDRKPSFRKTADFCVLDHNFQTTELHAGSDIHPPRDNDRTLRRRNIKCGRKPGIALCLRELNLSGLITKNNESHMFLVADGFGKPA